MLCRLSYYYVQIMMYLFNWQTKFNNARVQWTEICAHLPVPPLLLPVRYSAQRSHTYLYAAAEVASVHVQSVSAVITKQIDFFLFFMLYHVYIGSALMYRVFFSRAIRRIFSPPNLSSTKSHDADYYLLF